MTQTLSEPGGAGDVTTLLRKWSDGDARALGELTDVLYDELHRLARAHMVRERGDHTLQPTALLHETFLDLVRQERAQWQNRSQFLAVAARVMRRILVDHARGVQALKRGGAERTIPIDTVLDRLPTERDLDLVALDEALGQLAELDEEQARIVELRHFAGLTIGETAEVMGRSAATVKRRWDSARAWLRTRVAPA